jgi:hypothetical protein
MLCGAYITAQRISYQRYTFSTEHTTFLSETYEGSLVFCRSSTNYTQEHKPENEENTAQPEPTNYDQSGQVETNHGHDTIQPDYGHNFAEDEEARNDTGSQYEGFLGKTVEVTFSKCSGRPKNTFWTCVLLALESRLLLQIITKWWHISLMRH